MVGRRVTHLNQHDFLGMDHEAVKERVREYLRTHYELNGQTIFMAGDGGTGYAAENFFELLPNGTTHGEFFIDRYHALKKIQECLGSDEPMVELAQADLRKYDLKHLMAVIDTAASRTATKAKREQVDHLKDYFWRNWQYCSTPAQRGYQGLGLIGSVESSHRALTYRMKRQGKSWTTAGAAAMIGLVEARQNGELVANLRTCLKRETHLPQVPLVPLQEQQIRVADYLKQVSRPSNGALQGGFALDAPTSSPIGHLIKSFTH
ncbi:UPF0236 family transposase-like protein [Limosilactobacillus reuteri]|uniref:UPF0236 family transposase-like protein n=1 Tax=Limosilactobacillus reuteri TaxID=1598 RepID=UPI002D1FA928|nr:UPF0236 family protein [Limosilactobacillus reuteri]